MVYSDKPQKQEGNGFPDQPSYCPKFVNDIEQDTIFDGQSCSAVFYAFWIRTKKAFPSPDQQPELPSVI